jgi:GTP pyrophosphokinase
MPAVLARRLLALSHVAEKTETPPPTPLHTDQLLAASSLHLEHDPQAAIIINGNEGSAVHYSTCCHPIAGDQVIGHMRGGQGLFIHLHECVTAQRLRSKDPNRWVDIEWAHEVNGHFDTRIEVHVMNGRGVLGKVAATLSEAEANIVQVQMDEEAGTATSLKFKIQVDNRVHLAKVIRNLRNLAAVTRVSRSRN